MEQSSTQPLLIISGPLGAGKTSVANVLADTYGFINRIQIIEGKFAALVTKEEGTESTQRIYSLLLIAKKEIRYERIISQYRVENPQMSRKHIIQTIQKKEAEEKKDFQEKFPWFTVDPFLPISKDKNGLLLYDNVINTSYKSIDQAAKEVADWVKINSFPVGIQKQEDAQIERYPKLAARFTKIPTSATIFKSSAGKRSQKDE